MSNPSKASQRAQKMEDRCALVAIIFYAATVALGLGGSVLAAYGRVLPAALMGGFAVLSAALCLLTARASLRWRKAK